MEVDEKPIITADVDISSTDKCHSSNSGSRSASISEFEHLLDLTVSSGRLPAKLLLSSSTQTTRSLDGSLVPQLTLPVACILEADSATSSVLKPIWMWQSPNTVTSIGIGVFGDQTELPTVVVADTAGKLTLLKHTAAMDGDGELTTTQLDTKFSCISSMTLGNLANHTYLDVVVGDALGTVAIVLGGQQMFVRKEIGSSITCLAIESRPGRRPWVIVGDSFGAITSFDLHNSATTKTRLRDAALSVIDTSKPVCHMIRCIHPVALFDDQEICSRYLLVCDGSPFLYYLTDGNCAAVVKLPSQISCITSGYLSKQSMTNSACASNTSMTQIAVGGLDGYIYMVDKLKVELYANIDFTVTRLVPHRPPFFVLSDPDLLLCAGHCALLFVFQNKRLLHRLKTDAWVWDICSFNSKSQFVFCMLDNSVHAMRFKESDDEEGELVEE
ncbi:hypothetical protein BASA50_001241 [Batrachochytrium salamandrivorans]|uniref:Anaphase-promoting complex subunit 4 WD40 domain-containing protein n=1 Tax=Batrachochytrium salamandrivorans TaxID=1357716 RepID=A0ABQ8ESC7_9FUNG|nr:hypothetical protein BASA50_001241 [Batrachochytrium salamandrivorans]